LTANGDQSGIVEQHVDGVIHGDDLVGGAAYVVEDLKVGDDDSVISWRQFRQQRLRFGRVAADQDEIRVRTSEFDRRDLADAAGRAGDHGAAACHGVSRVHACSSVPRREYYQETYVRRRVTPAVEAIALLSSAAGIDSARVAPKRESCDRA
jgi:hypothetical protein